MIVTTKLLKKMVDDITMTKRSNTFTVRLTLGNYDDNTYRLHLPFVDVIEFNQNFESNTTDEIYVTANLMLDEVMKLVQMQNSLYATISIEYLDAEHADISLDEDPVIKEYRVFVYDLGNILKKYGVNAIKDTDDDNWIPATQAATRIPIRMQLINDRCYQINKQSFVGTLINVTPTQAIKYIASKMGIKKIAMIPADNNQAFHHLYIPPEYAKFNVVFEYLQLRYGVYTHGLSYYYTEDVLYVYPSDDVNIETKPKLTIVKVSDDTYLGLPNYHKESPGELTIISNTKSKQTSVSNISTENDGNSHMFIMSDKVIDGQVTVSGDRVTIHDITATCSNNLDNSIARRSAVPRYNQPTINVFEKASKIAANNVELMLLGWNKARLYHLTPGMQISFVYDDELGAKLKHGILSTVSYIIKKGDTQGDHITYGASASLLLKLEIPEHIANI